MASLQGMMRRKGRVMRHWQPRDLASVEEIAKERAKGIAQRMLQIDSRIETDWLQTGELDEAMMEEEQRGKSRLAVTVTTRELVSVLSRLIQERGVRLVKSYFGRQWLAVSKREGRPPSQAELLAAMKKMGLKHEQA